jgi:hypothetical protein
MEQKQAIADRLKQSNNILVTVSSNPSVDQLSACIGLTLALNKLGKHATAVFSGIVPSTLEFLQPDKTIEKNTDSLRDFIIALDKAKADKLRYKVEDKVVKIFITPYKTSISEKDLDFSQGDFNVDVVIALGVHQQNELDQAITAHGRILHDAVVATVNTKPGGELGTINWLDTTASSLSELTVQLIDLVDKEVMDGQMATALLTGIVAETNRFSNEKTTPAVMSASAELMGFGANPMLVATKLQEPVAPQPPAPTPPSAPTAAHDEGAKLQGDQGKPESHTDDGTLEIAHQPHEEEPWNPEGDKHEEPKNDQPEHHEDHHEEGHGDGQQAPEQKPEEEIKPEPMPAAPAYEPTLEIPKPEEEVPQIHIDEHGSLQGLGPIDNHNGEPLLGGNTDPNKHMASSHMFLQPPAMGGQMGATGMGEDEEETPTDPLSLPIPGGSGFQSGNGFGGASSAASANITSPDMPFLPPSMQPGGGVTPGTLSVPQAMPADAQSAPEEDDDDSNMVPPPAAPPQIVHPATAPEIPAPVPGSMDTSALPMNPTAPAPGGETLSEIEADVNSPHLQTPGTSFSPTPAAFAPPMDVPNPVPAPDNIAPMIQPPAQGAPLFANIPAPAAPSTPPPIAPDILPPAVQPAQPEPAPAPLPDLSQPAPAAPAPEADLATARDAVMQAIASQPEAGVGPEPIQALNAQPLGVPLHENLAAPAPAAMPGQPANLDAASNPTFTLPDISQAPAGGSTPPASPPPMMPPGGFGQ